MAKIEWKDEEIVIDNTQFLIKRADMAVISGEPGEEQVEAHKGDMGGLGGLMERGGEEERQLKEDKKRLKWYEPGRKIEVKHICPICGVHFTGRKNKVYCSEKCGNVARQRIKRGKARATRDFKPHVGTAGEVYFMATYDGKDIISFVPALYAQNRKQASEYIYKHYGNEKNFEDYIDQINEVIPK